MAGSGFQRISCEIQRGSSRGQLRVSALLAHIGWAGFSRYEDLHDQLTFYVARQSGASGGFGYYSFPTVLERLVTGGTTGWLSYQQQLSVAEPARSNERLFGDQSK